MVSEKVDRFEETARKLAAAHMQNDPDTHTVYLAPDPGRREIRLVEVSSATPDTDDVFPVYFGPRGDLKLELAVVLLSDREWQKVQEHKLQLPEGWGTSDSLKKLA